ncbi:RICIN domain-containing protein [Luteolibacter sp. GHJ8]|uniref:RICIN domain-containing protein n=1 Tax=Luteolibacter rhizosphaerae TaxID=2989719 RepID=A0ABT3G9E9_9BACT|nr:RICIN domain-containing protein [Luteolibacter rhizosphaerae]MCW1916465.1 RICIN domain-containing protein [Luteolibacter rhizosphaerae]
MKPKESTGPKDRKARSRCTRAGIVLVLLVAGATGTKMWTSPPLPSASTTEPGRETPQLKPSAPASQTARREKQGAAALSFGTAEAEGAAKAAALPERKIMGATWDSDPDPVIRDFAEWTKRYASGSEAERATMTGEGRRLAVARLTAISGQIEADPRRALANALPMAVRDALPEEFAGLMESRVSGTGDAGRVWVLAHQGETAEESPDFAEVDGVRYDAYRYGERAKMSFIDDGSIHGIAVDGRLAVLDSALRELELGERSGADPIDLCRIDETPGAVPVANAEAAAMVQFGERQATACCSAHLGAVESSLALAESQSRQTTNDENWNPSPHAQYASGDSSASGHDGVFGRPPTSHTHGTKSLLIMRAQGGGRNLTSQMLDNSYLTNAATDFHNRMQLASYGKAGISLTFTPVYQLSSWTNRDDWMNQCKALAQAGGYNLANYSTYVVILPDPGQGYAGVAYGNNIIMENNFAAWVFIHEYGHVLGLPHANTWRSSDGNPMSPSRTQQEYNDSSCWMGNNGSVHSTRSFNMNYLNRLGWLPDNTVSTVSRSGTYTIYQNDGAINLNDGRVRGLKVDRPDGETYWLSILGNNVDSVHTAFTNGVTFHTEKSWAGSGTALVDFNNPSYHSGDAPLGVNQEWHDSLSDVTFKTLSVGGTNPNRYATIQISFGPRYAGGHRPLVSGGVYRLVNHYNNQSLSGPAGTGNALPLVMATSNDADTAQRWVAWRNSDGTYSFNRQGSDKWIDVIGNSYANGADLVQHTASGSDAQRFYVRQQPNGNLYLAHKGSNGNSGQVIDMAQGNGDVLQWAWNSGAGQQWKPELVGIVPNANYRLIPNHAQAQAVEVDGANPNNGATVRMWHWNGQTHQQWRVNDAGSGRIVFGSVVHPTKSLDVNIGISTVSVWNTHNGSNQRWLPVRVGGGWMRFNPDYDTTWSMDVQGQSVANGASVTVQPSNGGTNQMWKFGDTFD